MNVGGTVYYLHADHLGSTSITTDGSGAVVSSQTYFAFGAIRSSSGNPVTDYGFTGQKVDAGDALMYYGARYYDPLLARFTQADTLVPGPANPQGFNRYSYVLNNPVRYTDPTGNKICGDDNNPDSCISPPPVNPNPTATPAPAPEGTATPPAVAPGGGVGGHGHHGVIADDENPSQPTATPTPSPIDPPPPQAYHPWEDPELYYTGGVVLDVVAASIDDVASVLEVTSYDSAEKRSPKPVTLVRELGCNGREPNFRRI